MFRPTRLKLAMFRPTRLRENVFDCVRPIIRSFSFHNSTLFGSWFDPVWLMIRSCSTLSTPFDSWFDPVRAMIRLCSTISLVLNLRRKLYIVRPCQSNHESNTSARKSASAPPPALNPPLCEVILLSLGTNKTAPLKLRGTCWHHWLRSLAWVWSQCRFWVSESTMNNAVLREWDWIGGAYHEFGRITSYLDHLSGNTAAAVSHSRTKKPAPTTQLPKKRLKLDLITL